MKRQEEIINQIVDLVQSHFSNWPLAVGQSSAMELISKAATNNTCKEWPSAQWENEADTIIQQFNFNMRLIALVNQLRPDISIHSLLIDNYAALTTERIDRENP